MKPEARLWQSVKTRLWMPGDRFDRVENSVISGQPDVNGCIESEDVWIELKAPVEPKRATTKLMSHNNHPLLQSQINWFVRQQQAGGIAFILVRTDKRMMLVDGTKHREVFNQWTANEMDCAALIVLPLPTKQDDWRLMRNVIVTASRNRRLASSAKPQQLFDDLDERKRVASDLRQRSRGKLG